MKVLSGFPAECIDLVYVDPPFYTQRTQQDRRRDNGKRLAFEDSWENLDCYVEWLHERVLACHRVLKRDGAMFLHCDWHASHRIRLVLDDVFGYSNFRNEIIWYYRRWTNVTKHLQRSHNNIYFYAKSEDTGINTLYEDYSPTTNLDQIWQKRARDENNRTVYASETGETIPLDRPKAGVPKRDVWDIPYLNPKAKERVGYPTQKPVELIEPIIRLASERGDVVLDPMMGSGTTLVAAKLLGRSFIGIDISKEALAVTGKRLESLVVSRSEVVSQGRDSFKEKINRANAQFMYLLDILDANPVYRNKNVDGFLRRSPIDQPVAVRIVAPGEDTRAAFRGFVESLENMKCGAGLLVLTQSEAQQLTLPFAGADYSKEPARAKVITVSISEVEEDPRGVIDQLEADR